METIRRAEVCRRSGLLQCINGQYTFRVQFRLTNTKQFTVDSSGQEACSVCGEAGEFLICRAKRCVKYGKKKKKSKGVSLWEPLFPHNIKPRKTNRTSEGNDKETSSLKANRNTICLCYAIAADGGRLGKSGKKKQHSSSTENASPIRNKVCAKKSIQVAKNLKP